MASKRIVVIGAGFAGLSAALRLRQAGAEVTVFESNDRVGGRTSSETWEGYVYERGTQFYVTTYRNALSLNRRSKWGSGWPVASWEGQDKGGVRISAMLGGASTHSL